DGDEQARAASGEPLDRGRAQAVAVVEPAREHPVDVAAEGAQRAHENRRRAHTVDVVVAVHGDPGARPDVAEDRLDGDVDAGERGAEVIRSKVETSRHRPNLRSGGDGTTVR